MIDKQFWMLFARLPVATHSAQWAVCRTLGTPSGMLRLCTRIATGEDMHFILTRKLADVLDGVDVSRIEVGDAINLSPREADLLLAEGWVVKDRRHDETGHPPGVERRRHASASHPPTLEGYLNEAS
jgi:hypothetical protein